MFVKNDHKKLLKPRFDLSLKSHMADKKSSKYFLPQEFPKMKKPGPDCLGSNNLERVCTFWTFAD